MGAYEPARSSLGLTAFDVDVVLLFAAEGSVTGYRALHLSDGSIVAIEAGCEELPDSRDVARWIEGPDAGSLLD